MPEPEKQRELYTGLVETKASMVLSSRCRHHDAVAEFSLLPPAKPLPLKTELRIPVKPLKTPTPGLCPRFLPWLEVGESASFTDRVLWLPGSCRPDPG